ncbi:hypothetical protein [Rhizobium halophytocola]|uniref:DUF4189 domain-containing protein n=1 Tax=Rhizobium halophytocola TaxID=735519 RepID=A0ABS4DY05_9HYPH|nr:hypothetical protein [Rhizobium halophytocola]MBP1850568.1 hypothetical protein [Rhizobium halophytocola]
MMRLLSTGIAILAIAAVSVHAQEGSGIAYVQAPEMSSDLCRGDTAAEAFACAETQCIEGGGTAQDCLEIAYCNPARFSVDVFVQHREGPHWHEFFCGLDNAQTAMAVADTICDRTRRPDLIECAPVVLYDPSGKTLDMPGQN